jgi:1-acyl-sn-glycerol-3-phosphate acyltransferase
MTSIFTTLRAWIFLPFVVLHTLFWAIATILVSKTIGVEPAMRMIRWGWAKPLLKFLGIQFEVRGAENFKLNRGSVVIFNHSSHMDIPLLFAASPKSIFFGAKVELFKIPFFGAAMRSVGALPIDRSQRSKVMKVYEAAVPRLKTGDSFALAPEGTRQTIPRLGSFKRGPFEFAIQAESVLQPVVISGALRILPNDTVLPNTRAWKSKVIVEFLGQITTYKEDDPVALSEAAHSHMSERLAALNEELGI